MNWIQLAASRLRKGTSFIFGWPSVPGSRLSSTRLMSRGLGVISWSPVSGRMADSATLRRKRVPAAPSIGSARLFQLPLAVRKCVTPTGGTCPLGWKPTSTSGG